MPELEIYIAGLEELRAAFARAPQRVTKEVHEAVSRSAITVQRQARIEAPVDTGVLRGGIATKLSTFSAIIAPGAKYAIYVHEGTGKYARNGMGRKTPWAYKGADGRVRFTVGTNPNPFMERAKNKSEHTVQAIFDVAARRIVEAI